MGAAHIGTVMMLVSNVTSPFLASNRPLTTTPVVAVIDVKAMMVPWKVDPVPSVAELPTCQKTLQAWAPLIRTTLLPEAVVSAEPIWKMKTALGSPCPSRVRVPVIPRVEEELYTPGARISPPMSPETVVAGVRLAASL